MSDLAYLKVQDIKTICLQSKTKEEAKTKVLVKYPDLAEFLEVFRPYMDLA